MNYQAVFKRYEQKYLITADQKAKLLKELAPYIAIDKYGRTTVRNLYFDTNNYRLIRHSIEKPEYKEKLRLRCYEKANSDSIVYAEIKKKYKSIVYKRRVGLTERAAMDWLMGKADCPIESQVTKEINYFKDFYECMQPSVFISYEREAYNSVCDKDLRITFDENILCRQTELSLCKEAYGTSVLPPDMIVMEIKSFGAIPMWLVKLLSDEKIYKTPFSKYGTAYKELIFPYLNRNLQGELHNV